MMALFRTSIQQRTNSFAIFSTQSLGSRSGFYGEPIPAVSYEKWSINGHVPFMSSPIVAALTVPRFHFEYEILVRFPKLSFVLE